jgi:hypothetical protein
MAYILPGAIRAEVGRSPAAPPGRSADIVPVQLADIPVPSTPAAQAAAAVLNRYSPPAMVNHCHRAYVLAASLALIDGVEIDVELLYVAALLHDLALEPEFDNHTLPFEDAGGHVAWVFAAGAGWPEPRRDHVAAVIVAHMRGTDRAIDAEGDLLDLATGLDVSGRNIERWPQPLLVELLVAYPRLDLAARFTACFRAQADRKPDSSAAASVRNGVADRLAAHPLDELADQGRYR